MPGTRVTATTTYCRHTLRAEVALNAQRDWIGRCVVTGPTFNGAVSLDAPLRTPTEALDTLLTAARQWVDAERDSGITASTSHGGEERLDGCPREGDPP